MPGSTMDAVQGKDGTDICSAILEKRQFKSQKIKIGQEIHEVSTLD